MAIFKINLISVTISCIIHIRAVARSENPEGLVVMGGDNVSTLVD